MAGKAKTKSTNNNKNIIIGICVAVVVIAVVAIAIFFATRKPQINDAYFVSDGSKYVITVDGDAFDSSEDVKYTPVKTRIVYTYSGDNITGMFTYAEFKDEATAKAALEEYKTESQEGIKSLSVNGKYVVAEMKEDQYSDMTASELKQYIDFIENVDTTNSQDSE